ncbi:MAG: acyltransferase [Bacteroidetes bacterium]|nr:acyltransferase [Bacteroidota bacterium]
MREKHLSFDTFNALRFFAFLKVFLLHVSQFEVNQFLYKLIFNGGDIGVDFFFVLSGFLITYLLAFEKLQYGFINGKNYFLRRSLRIWPLFYLGILIAYTNNFISSRLSIGSSAGYTPNFFFSITFLENYQMILHNNFPNGAPLQVFWSLCVEEHFYLLWFLLFRFITLKNISKALIILWLAGIGYRFWFYFQFPDLRYYDIDVISKLDYFCGGGLVGIQVAMHFEKLKKNVLKIHPLIRHCITLIVIFIFLFHHLIEGGRIADLYFPIISSTLFSSLILLVVTSSTFLHFNETHLFSRLGKISYGLYVYHTVIIVSILALIKFLSINFNNPITQYAFYIASFLLTIGVSTLSFRYFEAPFLKLKKRFTS